MFSFRQTQSHHANARSLIGEARSWFLGRDNAARFQLPTKWLWEFDGKTDFAFSESKLQEKGNFHKDLIAELKLVLVIQGLKEYKLNAY